MKISIIGNSLTGLILAKALANKNINFEIFYKAKTQNLKSNRTIAITNKNMAFLKADILSIPKKLVNPVNEIGILTENDPSKEILNFENKNETSPMVCNRKSETTLPWNPNMLFISLLFENTQFGSSAE